MHTPLELASSPLKNNDDEAAEVIIVAREIVMQDGLAPAEAYLAAYRFDRPTLQRAILHVQELRGNGL